MPAVFDRPAVPEGSEQGLGSSAQALDLLADLLLLYSLTGAIAADGDDRRLARSLLHHPLRCWNGRQGPDDVTAPFAFPLAGAPRDPPAVGEPIADQSKTPAGQAFYGDQEVGTALDEVEEKGRFACSASASTNTNSTSTATISCRKT